MTTTLHATAARPISGPSGVGVVVSQYHPNAQSAFTHAA